MSQPWTYRYPLIDFHGNNGSYDGDPPAAYRYSEGRLNKLAEYMLQGVDNDAVPMVPNYSETLKEPAVLPSIFPMAICEGTSGIAVGYTTNMPSHQLGEVADAIIATIEDDTIDIDGLMKHVKGPDYNTGSYLINNEHIKELYETGRAKLTFKAKYHIEENKNGTKSIVITELPPEINKQSLIEKLYKLCIEDKKIPRVSNVRDLSTDIYNIKITVDLQKTAVPELVVNQLYEMAGLTHNVSYIMRAIVNNTPKIFSLRELIDSYIEHRRSCIKRESSFLITKKSARKHIQEGLFAVTSNIKKAISIIEKSDDVEIAKSELMSVFKLDEEQAEAVLDLKLRKLTKLDKNAIKNLIASLTSEIDDLKLNLTDTDKVNTIIIDQLKDLKSKFNDKRKTEILSEKKASKALEVSNAPIVIALTNKGNIKHITEDIYSQMLASGKLAERTDVYTKVISATMKDNFLLILNDGSYVRTGFNGLLATNFLEKEQHIVNIFKLEESEEFNDKDVIVATKNSMLIKFKVSGLKAKENKVFPIFKELKDDTVVYSNIIKSNENNVITIVTKNGLVHRFHEQSFNSVATSGGKGLNCMSLQNGDEIVNMVITDKTEDNDNYIVMFTKHEKTDCMKTIRLNDFIPKGRMAKGVSAISYYKKNPGYVHDFTITDRDFDAIDLKGNIVTYYINELEPCTRTAKPEDINKNIIVPNFCKSIK